MARIQVLDKHVAELIAAGEVVERPSSVVKELFENAVDAGATSITVEIKNGGVTYLSVSDNGCGIVREDVPTAFLRHATSKVRTEQDLITIGTLGFRGEALASVAAVSRVELLTATEDSVGTRYVIEGGTELCCEDAAHPCGTTIMVRDLFYNVPARMKFLKKDVGEGNAVSALLERLALSCPHISVRFIRDGKEEFLTQGNGDLKNTIYAVLGKDFTLGLIPLSYTHNGVEVSGYICKPTYSRSNRTMQHFYINGRYVKSKTMMAALEQAYKGSLMLGRFPTCVMMMSLSPEAVDANVHPSKMEVRFVNEKPIFDAVYYGVKSALQIGDGATAKSTPSFVAPEAPITSASKQLYFNPPTASALKTPVPSVTTSVHSNTPPVVSAFKKRPLTKENYVSNSDCLCEDVAEVSPSQPSVRNAPPNPPPSTAEPAPIAISTEPVKTIRLVGECFDTYIFAEYDGAVYCIDKHAAHERILYNRLMETAHTDKQLLLLPVSVSLKKEEADALLSAREALDEAGYEVEDFGDNTLLVRSIPMMLTGCDVSDTLQEIAGGLLSGKREITTHAQEWICHSTACRAAIKAGAKNSTPELLELAQRVLLGDDVRYCPHGRPVCIRWSRYELEKLFGRVQ